MLYMFPLLIKLAKNGMNSKLLSLLKDMYSKMKLCVKSTYINNISNHPCYCNNLLQSTFTTQSSCNRCASCYNEQNDICYFSPLAGVFFKGNRSHRSYFLSFLMI